MSDTLELTGSAGTLTLGEDEIVAKDIQKQHTGISDGRIEVPDNPEIIPFVQRQDRVNYYVDGTCEFTGYAVGFAGNERTGRWTLRVDGIGKRLEETRPDYDSLGGSLTYSNISLGDALADYWPRTPFSVSVTPQSPDLVAEDEVVQAADTNSEWQNATTLPDSLPLTITGGVLELSQSCFTTEGENYDTGTQFGEASAGAYSDGSAVELSRDSNATGGPDFTEYNFTLDYTVPSDAFGFAFRYDTGGTEGGAPEFIIELEHANGSTYTIDENTVLGLTADLAWTQMGDLNTSYSGPDLTPGDYTAKITVTNSNSVGSDYILNVDVVAPYDDRYNYTFDNDNGGTSGYLDGPELYPDSVTTELDTVSTAYNIAASNVDSVWSDTSGVQAIAVSNDGGTNYAEFSNTSTVDHSYTTEGRNARVRFTFTRYGSRTTATPQQGYLGQSVDSFTHRVDLNDLTVIDELELSRNHFDNLKKLHNYGDFQWTIEHSEVALADLTVNSYPRGAITRATPQAFQDPENRSPEVAAETYFNSIYLQGQLREDGTRPTAEERDEDRISADGREISPGVLRDPSISTAAGAQFRAQALLGRALNNNDLRGSISTHPVYVEPGYEYETTFKDSTAERTLERVSIRESAGSINADYEFVVKDQLAETLNGLRQNARDTSDQV